MNQIIFEDSSGLFILTEQNSRPCVKLKSILYLFDDKRHFKK